MSVKLWCNAFGMHSLANLILIIQALVMALRMGKGKNHPLSSLSLWGPAWLPIPPWSLPPATLVSCTSVPSSSHLITHYVLSGVGNPDLAGLGGRYIFPTFNFSAVVSMMPRSKLTRVEMNRMNVSKGWRVSVYCNTNLQEPKLGMGCLLNQWVSASLWVSTSIRINCLFSVRITIHLFPRKKICLIPPVSSLKISKWPVTIYSAFLVEFLSERTFLFLHFFNENSLVRCSVSISSGSWSLVKK